MSELTDEEIANLPPSKSAMKREMTARQDLGVALCELSERELARIPIGDETLLEAIREDAAISSNSAKRRHRQYIGKLMRSIDPEPIQKALDALHEARRGAAQDFKRLEALRDQLVTEGDKALGGVLQAFPHADRQRLRQLVREAQKEARDDRPPAASRRLFRHLRELQTTD